MSLIGEGRGEMIGLVGCKGGCWLVGMLVGSGRAGRKGALGEEKGEVASKRSS